MSAPSQSTPLRVEPGAREAFADADIYDGEYRSWRQDAGFYRRTALDLLGGPAEILELACGSARVTRELVRGGLRVVGLDYSAEMLRQAQSRLSRLPRTARSRARLLRADMREFRLKRRFPLAICAFNSFEHLYTVDDVERCLRCVRDHLAMDGVFVFDVHNPDPRILAYAPTKAWGRKTFKTAQGRWLRRTLRSTYERDRQLHRTIAHYQPLAEDRKSPRGEPFERLLVQRQFFPQELDALIRNAGFEVALRLGDFDNQKFESQSPSQVLFCRPKLPPR